MADTAQLKVRLKPQRRRDVDALARARGISANDVINLALDLYFGPGVMIQSMADTVVTLMRSVTALTHQQDEAQSQIREIADFITDLHRDVADEDSGLD